MPDPIRPFIRASTRVSIGRREIVFVVDGDRPEQVSTVLEERVRAYCESESAATIEAASLGRDRMESAETIDRKPAGR